MRLMNLARCLMVAGIVSSAAMAATEEPGESSANAYWRESSPLKFNVGGGASYYNGNTGWGLTTGIGTRLTEESPIFVGVDLGFNFWSANSSLTSTSLRATGISLLPTISYGFEISGLKSVRPYMGLALGPMLNIESRTELGVDSSGSRVQFVLLLRPGVNIGISDQLSLNLEPKFGVIASSFVILPTASFVIGM